MFIASGPLAYQPHIAEFPVLKCKLLLDLQRQNLADLNNIKTIKGVCATQQLNNNREELTSSSVLKG